MTVEVRQSAIDSRGLFALVAIPAGTRILEYFGEKISKEEGTKRCAEENPFIFTLDDEWDLDGSAEANIARFINHSCEPNCDADVGGGQIWIVATRDINVGEEITYNYGYDYDDWKDHPCNCGAPSCVGYIVAEEYFSSVRRAREVAAAGLAELAKDS